MTIPGEAQPYVCAQCGQRADERPGFRLTRGVLEAVWVDDGAIAVEHVECLRCGHVRPVAAGSIQVRKP